MSQFALFRVLTAFVVVLLSMTTPRPAGAITISIEYSTDFGGDESPAWDSNGAILIAHFQAAKQIWEALLPGSGDITFDFQWDDDLGATTFGQYTPAVIDDYIEINPLQNWFADPTPNDSSEFAAPVQTLYSQVSPALQSSHFPATAPPGALEVGYRGTGTLNTMSAGGFSAATGFDLLSTIVHEMGHALGLSGVEPGNYNILPEHVGGLAGVEVLEGGGGHLAGQGNVPYLMCESCGLAGVRRFPTATDILVIAEEQSITNVKLARVGRISAGNWNNSNAWIGADVPDATQDAYVRSATAVTLDVNASVKSLLVSGGGSVDAASFRLASAGDIRFDGGAISVGAGGVVSANAIHGDPATLTTAAGSTVEVNNFTGGASPATAATFNGNVTIGVGAKGDPPVTFNPDTITAWNVGQNLAVGNEQRRTTLVIDNGEWTVAGNLDIRLGSEVMVDAGAFLGVGIVSGGKLGVTGPVTVSGALTYRGGRASNTTYTLFGGSSTVETIPPPVHLSTELGSSMIFENFSQGPPVGSSADSATINVGGGTGDGAPGAVVTFNGSSTAGDAEFWNLSGVGGASLRISNPIVIAGTGGRVVFEDSSYAYTAHFRNDGVAAHGPHGSGGSTRFQDETSATTAVFDNYGSTLQSYTGAVPAPGGRTEFFDTASASDATFNNHPGQGMGSLGAGVTIFRGSSTASTAEFFNKGGVPGAQHGGSTEFYDNATAGNAEFYNQHAVGVTQHAGSAGNVRFYGSSTAGNATFYNQVGGGAVYFNDSSKAGDAHFFIEDTGTGTFGGHVVFSGNSKGGTSDITVRENAFSATVEFKGTSNAENAEITLVNGSQAYVPVSASGSLGFAKLDIGSGGSLTFRDSATAADSTIHIRPGGGGDFTGVNTTAGNATITLDGATVANGGTGSLNFSGGRGGTATINVNPGNVFNSAGAQISFNNSANAGTAKIIGGSATVAGAGGARISIDTSSNISNATITVGAGGYLNINGFGAATVGSLELTGGAAVYLNQTELRAGALNTSTTISGPIVGVNGNSKFTKVGTGTITLTGANTYTGLTKVDGGTLVLNGTTPGAAEVNSGATLKGTGSIGGAVTVKSGGTLAPGNSAGKITVGSFSLPAGGTLAMELGGTTAATQYDQVISSGAFSLAGALQVSLINGFAPSVGQSFNLFDWASVSGTFASLNLPTLMAGLAWNTSQLYSTGVVSVSSATFLAADFDEDGDVDGADLTRWRDNFGTGTTHMTGDADGDGDADGADFLTWQRQLGTPPSVVAGAAVPEPASMALASVVLIAGIRRRRMGWPRNAVFLPLCHAEA